ncbi:MAG: TolB-like 6-bladed beta-propeller domain-containing protein, partial [Prevotellaceae bacterium]|nr:TolB-like 6-bladed beta-propeller domain-containing protein [Prevotellaceae bacterium]
KIEFAETVNLNGELILVNEVLHPVFLTFNKSGFLIVSSYKSDDQVFVYTLPDLKYHTSFGKHGQGPGDMQAFAMFCNSLSESLYIWGYTDVSIKRFLCDSVIRPVEKFRLAGYESVNNMHIANDSILIYNLMDQLEIKKTGLKSGKEIDKIQLEKDNHRESYYFSNRGILAANDRFIVYTYLYKKEIDIYDIETMKLKTKLKGDYNFEMPQIGNFNSKKYYINVLAGKNYFYALTTNEDNSKMIDMEVYDYEGNSVVKYSFDINPQLFTIDEENNYMYGYSEAHEDYFLRYKLPLIKDSERIEK